MAWYDELPRPQFLEFPAHPAEDWYTVLKLPQRIWAIAETRHFQEVLSFLIPGETHALLLDTGMGIRPIRPVAEALTDLPLTVLNSHGHWDHVGGNHEFSDIWSWETEEAGLDWIPAEGNANFQPFAFRDPAERPETYCRPAYTYRTLREGQRFDLGGRCWEVLHTPGHSPDSVVLANDAEKLLCMGDTLYPGTIYAQRDPVTYARTLRRLADRYAEYTLLCSHNEPIRPGSFLCAAADAFDAMLTGRTEAAPEGDGLWRHAWGEIRILSPIAGQAG